MKKMLVGMMVLMFAGSTVLAADVENKQVETIDSHTNPLTGTKTETKKYSKKMKGANGHESNVDVKEKTKTKSDGTKKTTTEVDAESTSK